MAEWQKIELQLSALSTVIEVEQRIKKTIIRLCNGM